MSWQISAIKTSQERGRNRQFERREKARKNGIKSVLAVFGCQIGKRADSQKNSGEEKAQDIVVFRSFGRGYIAAGNVPFLSGCTLVRKRSPVQIRLAAPKNPLVSERVL